MDDYKFFKDKDIVFIGKKRVLHYVKTFSKLIIDYVKTFLFVLQDVYNQYYDDN